MSLLAISLYDLALIHCETKEYKQAEREILKSVKLLERLVKINPERYSTAQLTALNASTSIYRSRVDQANLLATYEVETSTYLAEVNNGIVEATTRLITSLQNVGDTLSQIAYEKGGIIKQNCPTVIYPIQKAEVQPPDCSRPALCHLHGLYRAIPGI